MPRHVVVRAPSRLHFGLFALSGGIGRRYGGVGAMIRQPGLKLRFDAAPTWTVDGLQADRIEAAAFRWQQYHHLAELPPCRASVLQSPPLHVGLGVGTQLALSVAAGLSAFCQLPAAAPQELARSVGRAGRSAVGTYGFALGGLIVEPGKLEGEPVSPLDTRLDLPASWRFLLIRPTEYSGLSGDAENAAMDRLAVPPETTAALIATVRERLIPAAATADFPEFAESLFDYCELAGSFYAPLQGGTYNGPVLTSLVARIRSLGVSGIGQSSWGPTLFVVQPDDAAARSLAGKLQNQGDGPQLELAVAEPDNHGAEVVVINA